MNVRRVLVAGTWDEGAGYPRTRSLLAALERRGVRIERVHVELPRLGTRTRAAFLRAPWRWPSFALRLRRARRQLQARVVAAIRDAERRGERYDFVLVPYPGHLAVRWIRRVVGLPVVLDLFLSAYGTVVEDRRLFRDGSLPARAMLHIDRAACAAADLVLLDTPQHGEWVRGLVAGEAGKFGWVPISEAAERNGEASPGAGHELNVVAPGRDDAACGTALRVLFFGTGVALHGLRVLCDAVAKCDAVHLTLVGGTHAERAHARATVPAERLAMGAEFEPFELLRERLAMADLVAGVFGTSHKAASVVPYKVVHALAAGRPVITADTAAIRAFLSPELECLVVPAGDAVALAARLSAIAADRSQLVTIGRAARAAYERSFSAEAVGERFFDAVTHLAPTRLAASGEEQR